MTFQLRHDWHDGARVNGAQLATCANCETLRVELGTVEGMRVHYIRRVLEPPNRPEQDPLARVTLEAPRCISPAGHFRAPFEEYDGSGAKCYD